MHNEQSATLDSLRLDWANECLQRGSQTTKLRPKAFAVLGYLLGRPGELITKEELLNAIWPETFVSDANLKVAIRQLRQALRDDPKSPRFIETAHRRGYRFIGRIDENGQMLGRDQAVKRISGSWVRSANSSQEVVERHETLSRMRSCLERMLRGERQTLFVTGEAGIGKTAVVDMFARSIASNGRIRTARGQCLEQYGTGEAYLPVLEAIGRLCRDQADVVDVLRAQAPMWLVQMPSLLKASERELLSREVLGATRERMLREMGQALETLASDQPLVFILEDLHWSDYSTLDLVSYVSRQRETAKLMLIGTYRPVELIVSGHPLKAVKQELLAKQQCEELSLEYLSKNAIAEYLSLRFPNNRFPAALAGLIHKRTGGNPLFMVNAVDYLVMEGLIVERENSWNLVVKIENVEVGVPASIKQMIEKQVDHLDGNAQRTLEAASVAGAEFSALAVVAGLGEDLSFVEGQFDELARRYQFVQHCGVQVLPNGEAISRYGFIHDLYRTVLYDRVSESRRVQLHRRIAERGEEVYGDRSIEIAAEFAMHFERGRDYKKAARYLQQAANNAIRRFAYREAVGLSRRGLELLAKLPDSNERAQQELCLQLTLGVPLIATEGYAAPDVGAVYLRARELCQQMGDTPDVSEALWGLWTFYTLKGDLATARETAEEYLRLADRFPELAMRGHWALEITFMHLGEFALSIDHFNKALALYNPERHLDDAFLYAQHPGVAMPCFAAWVLWFLGRPDEALDRIREGLTLARQLSEPHGLAHAFFCAAIVHQLRGEERMAQEHADAAITVSREHGLVLYEALATVTRASSRFRQGQHEGAISEMRQGLAAHQATGTKVLRSHFLALLAEALDQLGQIEEGLRLLEEGLVVAHSTGERYYEAELHRLKGQLLLRQADQPPSHSARETAVVESESPAAVNAENCFNQAIKIAQRQEARSLELRAVMSLANLRHTEGRHEEARALLANIFGSFTEGFDTRDLRQVKALLDQLP